MKKGLKIGIIIGIILIIIIGIIVYFTVSKPKITLLGGEYIKTELKHEYEDKGVSIKVNGKEISKNSYKISSKDNIDTNALGIYKETYNIEYKNRKYKVERTIEVVDTEGPIINTNLEKIETDFCTEKEKKELTFTAIDNGDGDLTDKVIKEQKDSSYYLTVSDSKGNETIKQIPIEKEEEPNPVIKINGTSPTYITIGDKYTDKGAYVSDVCGNKKNIEVKTSGKVDSNKIGTYKIEYSAIYNEKELKLTREVKVVKKSTPVKKTGSSNKIVYLTFDDGPGAYTKRLLDILDKYNVKATFFVTHQYPKFEYLIKEEAKRGHAVAVHSYSHNYNKIYTSVNAYKEDFNKMNDIIEKQTGKRSIIFRFPGGGSNTVSRKACSGCKIMTQITKVMAKEGYYWFDWNVSSGDADGHPSKEKTTRNVINGMKNYSNAVILMHDIHKSTVDAMEEILKYGTENGYTFKVLDETSPAIRHKVNN